MINDVSRRPDVASRPLGRICDSRDFPGATTSLPSSSFLFFSSSSLSFSLCFYLSLSLSLLPTRGYPARRARGRCRTSFSFGTSIGIPAVGERFRRDNLRIYRRVGRRVRALFRNGVYVRAPRVAVLAPRKNATLQAHFRSPLHANDVLRAPRVYDISNARRDKGYTRARCAVLKTVHDKTRALYVERTRRGREIQETSQRGTCVFL